jgi:hypothetical protein
MTENFATSLIVAEDDTGPAGVITGPFSVRGTSALLTRQTQTAISRRDMWRAVTHQIPILSRHQIGWEFESSDSETTELLFDALGDPGRTTDVAGLRTWSLGQPNDVRRYNFVTDPVEGGHFELRGAACVEAQVVVDRGRLATWTTQWIGRQLTTEDSDPTATDASGDVFGGALQAQVEFSDIEATVLSCAVAFTRDITPAQYDLDNIATQWVGRHAVDAVGRIICRLPFGDYAELILGDIIETDLTISLTTGDKLRQIILPAVRLQANTRALVSAGTYEYSVEFVAVREYDSPVAYLTSGPV